MTLRFFSWMIERELAGMAWPDDTPEGLAELRAVGVGAIVNLTHRPPARECLHDAGIHCLQLPVHEFEPPRPDQIDCFIDYCDRQIAEGRGVAVHCLAGKGRTGTMLACYLVHRGMAAAEAMATVRRVRPGSIETRGQEAAVHQYAWYRRPPTEQ